MIIRTVRKYTLMVSALLLVSLVLFPSFRVSDVHAEETTYTVRPSVNGHLHVSGTDLVDEADSGTVKTECLYN